MQADNKSPEWTRGNFASLPLYVCIISQGDFETGGKGWHVNMIRQMKVVVSLAGNVKLGSECHQVFSPKERKGGGREEVTYR